MQSLKYLILLLLTAICNNAWCSRVLGLDVDTTKAYYVIDNEVYCRNVFTNAEIWKKNLSNDSLIPYNLFISISKNLQLKGDSILKAVKSNVRKYKVLNLSFNAKRIFIGIQFRTEFSDLGKQRYAILEFDTVLNFKNLYHFDLRHPYRFFKLTPTVPFNFSSKNSIVLSIYEDIAMSFYEFELNMKYRKAIPVKKLFGIAQIRKGGALSLASTLVLEPMFISVKNTTNSFSQFPFPLIKTSTKYIDPFQVKNGIDSFNRAFNSKTKPPIYSAIHLPFEYALQNNPTVIHSALQKNDSLIMLCLNSKSLILVKSDLKSGSHIKRVLTAIDHNDFYLLTEKYVLVLKAKESGHRFEVIRI